MPPQKKRGYIYILDYLKVVLHFNFVNQDAVSDIR